MIQKEFADGSRIFGGLIGPSKADRILVNSLSDWEVHEKSTPDKTLNSPKRNKILSTINVLPPSWRMPVLTGLAVGAVGFTVACGATGVSAEEENLVGEGNIEPESLELDLTADLNPFMIFPVLTDPNIRVQQGWLWSVDNEHKGVDIINGQIGDSRTWETFAVRAVAAGEACLNPPNSEGDAVFIAHNVGGEIIHSYYGHLRSWIEGLPNCGRGTMDIDQGQIIGWAGSSGMRNSDYIHLHFQVNRNNEPIDPFDLYATRQLYPDLSFSNGQVCGENSLFFSQVCPRTINDIVNVEEDTNILPDQDIVIEQPIIGEQLDPINEREAMINSRSIEARNLTLEFIDLLLVGKIDDLDKAFYMQATYEQRNLVRSVDWASYADINRCSEQMILGEMQNISITRSIDPPVELDELEIFNRERGYGNTDLWRVQLKFRFNPWNGHARERGGFQDFDPINHDTTLYFAVIDDQLKITHNFLCNGWDSAFGITVNYIPGQ